MCYKIVNNINQFAQTVADVYTDWLVAHQEKKYMN
jgi:hypothetical protein